jgi:hypothetical protein
MAQKSIPWPRGVAADSLVGYTSQEWAGIWAAMQQAGGVIKITPNLRTVAEFSNVGVFYSVANRLVVTTAVNRVNVDTGAALVCGQAFYNDTIIGAGGDITNPGAGLARYDRVVLRCNFSAADYVPGFASAALFTVPSYTARITIVHGADGGGAPALTQDQTLATYWDIPLYQYIITEGGGIGTITVLTDQREWVDAETVSVLVPQEQTWNSTDITANDNDAVLGPELTDQKWCAAYNRWIVEAKLIGEISIYAVIESPAAGNMYSILYWYAGACSEAYDTHTNYPGGMPVYVEIAVIDNVINCVQSVTTSGVFPEDVLYLHFLREATDPLDTVDANVKFSGFKLTYLRWR